MVIEFKEFKEVSNEPISFDEIQCISGKGYVQSNDWTLTPHILTNDNVSIVKTGRSSEAFGGIREIKIDNQVYWVKNTLDEKGHIQYLTTSDWGRVREIGESSDAFGGIINVGYGSYRYWAKNTLDENGCVQYLTDSNRKRVKTISKMKNVFGGVREIEIDNTKYLVKGSLDNDWFVQYLFDTNKKHVPIPIEYDRVDFFGGCVIMKYYREWPCCALNTLTEEGLVQYLSDEEGKKVNIIEGESRYFKGYLNARVDSKDVFIKDELDKKGFVQYLTDGQGKIILWTRILDKVDIFGGALHYSERNSNSLMKTSLDENDHIQYIDLIDKQWKEIENRDHIWPINAFGGIVQITSHDKENIIIKNTFDENGHIQYMNLTDSQEKSVQKIISFWKHFGWFCWIEIDTIICLIKDVLDEKGHIQYLTDSEGKKAQEITGGSNDFGGITTVKIDNESYCVMNVLDEKGHIQYLTDGEGKKTQEILNDSDEFGGVKFIKIDNKSYWVKNALDDKGHIQYLTDSEWKKVQERINGSNDFGGTTYVKIDNKNYWVKDVLDKNGHIQYLTDNNWNHIQTIWDSFIFSGSKIIKVKINDMRYIAVKDLDDTWRVQPLPFFFDSGKIYQRNPNLSLKEIPKSEAENILQRLLTKDVLSTPDSNK